MKLMPAQISAHLAKQLMNFYFITGDEILLVDELRQTIKNAAKKQGFLSCDSYQIDDAFDFDHLQQQLHQITLFSDKAIIELRFPNHKFSDAAKKFLQFIITNPPEDKILIVVTDKLDANQLKTKWLQAVENASGFIQIWPITRDNLPQWIKQRCQQLQLTLDVKASVLLADICEGNLLACAQALEQLKLLFGTEKVTADQVLQAISDNSRFDIFSLVDSVIIGETLRSYRILQNLQQEGIEAILILWALARECRAIMDISWEMQKGHALEKCLQKAKIWPKRQPLIKKALLRKSYPDWQYYLTEMQTIDREIKGAKKGNPWLSISDLVMKVAS